MAGREGDHEIDDSETAFRFSDLPFLVQAKILRQYIPLSDKLFVLNRMVEFQNLLNRQTYCWLHRDDAFFHLLPPLRRLTPGFYVRSNESIPDHAFHVSIDKDIFSINLCLLTQRYSCHFFDPFYVTSRTILKPGMQVKSPDEFKNDLHFFLDSYWLVKYAQDRVYDIEGFLVFVNWHTKRIRLRDCIYPISQNEKYCFKVSSSKNVRLYLDTNNESVVVECEQKISLLQGEALESLFLNEKRKMKGFRTACIASFKIAENRDIIVSKKVFNEKAYNRYMVYNKPYLKFK